MVILVSLSEVIYIYGNAGFCVRDCNYVVMLVSVSGAPCDNAGFCVRDYTARSV